jgi:hypothetical protein
MLHGSLFADNARHFFFLYMEYQSLIIPPPHTITRDDIMIRQNASRHGWEMSQNEHVDI